MSRRRGPLDRANPIVTYTWLWPGLTRAWLGEWPGLGQAVGFALIIDTMLLATVVWDEVLGSTAAWIGWTFVVVAWLVGAWAGRRRLNALNLSTDVDGFTASPEDLFPQALNEYLQGNWLAAEEKCRELVRRRRDDVEARLLLATLLRHSERLDEARRALDDLEKFDGAGRWEMEIACERRLLEEAAAENESEVSETDEGGTDESAEVDVPATAGGNVANLPTRRAA